MESETTGTICSRKKKESNAAEEAAARKLGGKRVRQSGARPWAKDRRETEGKDGETPDFAFEHKRIDPDTKGMRIERKWLEQITKAARRSGKEPALVLRFDRNHVGGELEKEFVKPSQTVPEEWLMLPIEVAARLLGVNVESPTR
jgi:hypothetical protein